MHPAQLPLDTLLADCQERRLRRSGPGGQHRNKVETAVALTHLPTGIGAEASERRSQNQNRAVAVQRLRVRLAVEVRSIPADEPTTLWRERSRQGRLSLSDDHEDFPALLAEALDHVSANEGDDAFAAERLGVSRTQLINLLRREPPALARLNALRAQRGANPLR